MQTLKNVSLQLQGPPAICNLSRVAVRNGKKNSGQETGFGNRERHSEPSNIPFSPNQILVQDFFALSYIKTALVHIGTLQMFAGIYRDFAGKSECGDFKFMGIACIPAIPVIFEVNQKKVWSFYICILFIKIFQISL